MDRLSTTLSPLRPAGRGPTARCAATLALTLGLAVAASCGSTGGGRPDEDLEGLVHPEQTAPRNIDVDLAAREVPELRRALALPHRRVAEVLGSHRFRVTSSAVVHEGNQEVEKLEYQTSIDIDDAGNFHALSDNNRDYGREVFLVGDQLYLRPRHAPKFYRRAPNDADEAAAIRNDLFSTFGAYFDVLAARAELVDRGHTEVSGRDGRKIEIKTAPEAKKPRGERPPEERWRDDATVREVTGEVVLDAESGALLTGTLRGTAVLARDGRSFEMTLSVDHQISDIGAAITVTPPAEDQTVTSIEQPPEAEDRDVLLKGIAPPARKAPTPPHNGDSEDAP